MATRRKTATSKKPARKTATQQTVTRVERVDDTREQSLFERLSNSFQQNQSFFNIILGGLIVVVLGVLLFNYFNRPAEDLAGPAPQTETEQAEGTDVAKDNLPGKYTVKEGDTLFSIAQNYYDDGYKYPELVEANTLANENALTAGQVLEIPKLDDTGEQVAQASATPEMAATPAPTASPEAVAQATPAPVEGGTGGAENSTAWGERITGDTYTVQADDWLSKIAGRAYGDVMAYQRIAAANNITNPDAIEVGMTLKIPR